MLKIRLSRKAVFLLALVSLPLRSIAEPASELWDSAHERESLALMVSIGNNLCLKNPSSTGGPSFAAVTEKEKHVLEYIQRSQQNPLYPRIVKRLMDEVGDDKKADASAMLAPILEAQRRDRDALQSLDLNGQADSNSTAMSDLLHKINDEALQARDLGRKVFLTKRIKMKLLELLPEGAAARKDLVGWKKVNFDDYGKLLEISSRESSWKVTSTQELGPLLRLDLERLEVWLGINQQMLSKQKEAREKTRTELEKVISKTARAPFTTEDLVRDSRLFLEHTTMAGAGFSDCGLTLAEHVAIEAYSEGFYLQLNEALWKNEPIPSDIREMSEIMVSGMNKLKPFVGIVLRDAYLPATALAEHQTGATVLYKGFTSTSIRGGYSSRAKVHLKIRSKTGRYISPFTQLWSESEVLFAPNTKFRVLNRAENPDGSAQIELEEI